MELIASVKDGINAKRGNFGNLFTFRKETEKLENLKVERKKMDI
jgi:hypothetical protein